jgi:hypothetical protein
MTFAALMSVIEFFYASLAFRTRAFEALIRLKHLSFNFASRVNASLKKHNTPGS